MNSVTTFAFKTLFPHQVWFIIFSVDYAIYEECLGHRTVRSGENIGISPLTNKSKQLRKDSAACHHCIK